MEVMNQYCIDTSESTRIDEVVEFFPMQNREAILDSQQWESSPIDTSITIITISDANASSSSSHVVSPTGKTEDTDSKSMKSTKQKFITEIVDSEEYEKSHKHSVMPLKKVREEEDEVDLKSKLKLIKEMLGEDEEIVEVEFETAVKHINTHNNTTIYCPNCSSCITKLLIRKKKLVVQPKTQKLLGCFSCFSLFIPSGDGIKLWPFVNNKPKPTQTSLDQITQTPAKNVQGNCFSMFGIFTNGKRNEPSQEVIIDITGDKGPETETVKPFIPPVPDSTVTNPDSKSVEILKSILYGGLTELIASLSIVSSAAASGATTLNIISIAIANLIGGLIVIFHNLGDLRIDQVERYQEILGRRENFLLHATFVILSFLLFGIIPPVTYAVTFRTNDDTDLKLAAVATASLLCIIILAIGKAYIYNQPRFYVYFKTIMYYIVITVSVSGVSYAVGDYINILIGRLGWFETSSAVVPQMKSISQAWVSY